MKSVYQHKEDNFVARNKETLPTKLNSYLTQYYQNTLDNNLVLKNKKNITDRDELQKIENLYREKKGSQMQQKIKQLSFDQLVSAKTADMIHFKIFEDLYEWAGKLRNANMTRVEDGVPVILFTPYYKIESQRQNLFHQMRHDLNPERLATLSPKEKSKKLISYYLQLYKIHSYPEGNTIVSAILFDEMATRLGLTLRLTEFLSEDSVFNSVRDVRGDHKLAAYHNMSALHTLKEFVKTMPKKDKEAITIRPFHHSGAIRPFIDAQQEHLAKYSDTFYDYLCELEDENGKPLLSANVLGQPRKLRRQGSNGDFKQIPNNNNNNNKDTSIGDNPGYSDLVDSSRSNTDGWVKTTTPIPGSPKGSFVII